MKICTLIPAYKTRYIENLLVALSTQTVRPYRIIFSDDSPGGVFRERLLSPELHALRSDLNIEVVEGPRNGAFENFKNLIRLWNEDSEFFHILLDDDVIYPEFYQRHLSAHASGDFSCSISRRWESNEEGQPTRAQETPNTVSFQTHRMLSVSDDVAFMSTVAECRNWFGEFSNAVFKKGYQDLVLEPRLASVSYAGLWDLGAFLAASTRRPICHIEDYLGFFRKGPDQNSAQTYSPIMKAALLAYVALGISGKRLGKLNADQSKHCFGIIGSALQYWYGKEEDMAIFRLLVPQMLEGGELAETAFLNEWEKFLATHNY